MIYFLPSLSISAQNNITKEGLLHLFSDAASDSLTLNSMWFKDSAVIYESKGFYHFETGDSVINKGYDVYKYIYFDLKTGKAQDYYSFTDTAAVAHNYIISREKETGWNYFKGENREDLTTIELIPDTLLEKENFKRIKFRQSDSLYNYRAEIIYYLSCNSFTTDIIHINKVIESMFPGCMISRIEYITLSPQLFKSLGECKLVRTKCTEEENRIFAQWKKNAEQTTMPVLTYEEVRKMPGNPLKFKNGWFH